MTSARSLAILAALAAIVVAASVPAQTSVPPARFTPPPTQREEPPPRLLLPRAAAAHVVALPAPDASEGIARKSLGTNAPSASGKRHKSRALAVGYPRSVPPADSTLRLADLRWQGAAGGMIAAHVTVSSPGAAAVRVGMVLDTAPSQLTLRFQGSGANAQAFGPVFAGEIERIAATDGTYWSPILEGDTATIEFAVPA